MLTSLEHRVFIKILDFSSKLGFVPFIFENGILWKQNSNTPRYIIFITIFVFASNFLFFTFQARIQFLAKEDRLALLSCLMMLASIAAIGILTNLELNASEIIQLSNDVAYINREKGKVSLLVIK